MEVAKDLIGRLGPGALGIRVRAFEEEKDGARAAVSRASACSHSATAGNVLVRVDESYLDPFDGDGLVHREDVQPLVVDFELELDEVRGAAGVACEVSEREGEDEKDVREGAVDRAMLPRRVELLICAGRSVRDRKSVV